MEVDEEPEPEEEEPKPNVDDRYDPNSANYDPFPDSSPYIDSYDIEPTIYGFFEEPSLYFTKKGRPFHVHHDKDHTDEDRRAAWRSRHRKIWPLVSEIFNVRIEPSYQHEFIHDLQPQFEATGLPKQFFASLLNYVDK